MRKLFALYLAFIFCLSISFALQVTITADFNNTKNVARLGTLDWYIEPTNGNKTINVTGYCLEEDASIITIPQRQQNGLPGTVRKTCTITDKELLKRYYSFYTYATFSYMQPETIDGSPKIVYYTFPTPRSREFKFDNLIENAIGGAKDYWDSIFGPKKCDKDPLVCTIGDFCYLTDPATADLNTVEQMTRHLNSDSALKARVDQAFQLNDEGSVLQNYGCLPKSTKELFGKVVEISAKCSSLNKESCLKDTSCSYSDNLYRNDGVNCIPKVECSSIIYSENSPSQLHCIGLAHCTWSEDKTCLAKPASEMKEILTEAHCETLNKESCLKDTSCSYSDNLYRNDGVNCIPKVECSSIIYSENSPSQLHCIGLAHCTWSEDKTCLAKPASEMKEILTEAHCETLNKESCLKDTSCSYSDNLYRNDGVNCIPKVECSSIIYSENSPSQLHCIGLAHCTWRDDKCVENTKLTIKGVETLDAETLAALEGLKSSDAEVRADSARELGRIWVYAGNSVPLDVKVALLISIKDSDTNVKSKSIWALGDIWNGAGNSVPTDVKAALLLTIRDSKAAIRGDSAMVLNLIWFKAGNSVPTDVKAALLVAIKDSTEDVRYSSAQSMGYIWYGTGNSVPEEVKAALLLSIKDAGSNVRGFTAQSMGDIWDGTGNSVPTDVKAALLLSIKDSSEMVGRYSASAMGSIWSRAKNTVPADVEAALLNAFNNAREGRSDYAWALAYIWADAGSSAPSEVLQAMNSPDFPDRAKKLILGELTLEEIRYKENTIREYALIHGISETEAEEFLYGSACAGKPQVNCIASNGCSWSDTVGCYKDETLKIQSAQIDCLDKNYQTKMMCESAKCFWDAATSKCLLPKGGYCDSQTSVNCGTKKCINNYCCDANECGENGKCYQVDPAKLVEGIGYCVSEGVWKYTNGHYAENEGQCSSGHLTNRICCEKTECGCPMYHGGCQDDKRCIPQDGWRTYSTEGDRKEVCNKDSNGVSVWKVANGNYADKAEDCSSGYLTNRICCEKTECGCPMYHGGCQDDKRCIPQDGWRTYSTEGDRKEVCNKDSNGVSVWKVANGNYADKAEDCSSGYLTNRICCEKTECGYENQCYAPGKGPTGRTCQSDGTWIVSYGANCNKGDKCEGQAVCNADGVCCNTGECGLRNGQPSCYLQGNRLESNMCKEGEWKLFSDELVLSCTSGKLLGKSVTITCKVEGKLSGVPSSGSGVKVYYMEGSERKPALLSNGKATIYYRVPDSAADSITLDISAEGTNYVSASTKVTIDLKSAGSLSCGDIRDSATCQISSGCTWSWSTNSCGEVKLTIQSVDCATGCAGGWLDFCTKAKCLGLGSCIYNYGTNALLQEDGTCTSCSDKGITSCSGYGSDSEQCLTDKCNVGAGKCFYDGSKCTTTTSCESYGTNKANCENDLAGVGLRGTEKRCAFEGGKCIYKAKTISAECSSCKECTQKISEWNKNLPAPAAKDFIADEYFLSVTNDLAVSEADYSAYSDPESLVPSANFWFAGGLGASVLIQRYCLIADWLGEDELVLQGNGHLIKGDASSYSKRVLILRGGKEEFYNSPYGGFSRQVNIDHKDMINSGGALLRGNVQANGLSIDGFSLGLFIKDCRPKFSAVKLSHNFISWLGNANYSPSGITSENYYLNTYSDVMGTESDGC